MERIDLLVRIQVLRSRLVAGDDAFRGLAISDGDIDAVFLRPLGAPHWTAAADSDELAHLALLYCLIDAALRCETLVPRADLRREARRP